MGCDSDVEVSAWVKIGDSATIDYHVVANEGQVEFSVGGHDGFDLVTTERGLHTLLERAQEALRAIQRATAHDDQGPAPA